ncbi:MAG: DNA-directed RNA polymerase subunit beta' [Candidatus Cloacimonetes bacterium]|nr:DNA-directed RNA polymerase subunit beta' [Candidatus Cloacimonadota bacterium]
MLREIKRTKKIETYDNVRIKIASPETMREWSFGEVTKPDTLNYRTLKPEKDGLFCERIFGPERDYECSCGKYKKKRFANTICDRCGVEVTTSRVRRSRMGHIELAVPIAHIWFVKSMPSKIGTLLDLTIKELERVLYYESYIVTDPGETTYERYELLDIEEYYENRDQFDSSFKALIGAEAIKYMLDNIDLDNEALNLRSLIRLETSALKKQKAVKTLKIVDAFRKSGNKPGWMILEVLPVLPPTLRPLVPLEGGRFATADFNDLYRRVITRNNRLKQLIEIRAPEVILRNEKRMLQEAVDALLDNSRKTRPVKGRGGRVLKSLADQLKGKQGRFRQNLLGKRVDYSGRSVITAGPNLKLHQCGLPKDMAAELFKPFIIERLERIGEAEKMKSAKKMVEKKQPEIWKILEDVIQDYPVLLNRAPTLHKLGIQAFMPVLIEGKAIELHPMVCTPYNADFDGDQMAVYIPLSQEARMEARVLMLSSRNILLPANGKLAMTASQDIVLGCYYITLQRGNEPKDEELKKLRYFESSDELILAYEQDELLYSRKGETVEGRTLDIHTWIRIKKGKKFITTTVGRVIFNQILPKELPFMNFTFNKSELNELAMKSFHAVGQRRTAVLLDDLKDIGFKYATKAGITFSANDVIVPTVKKEIIDATELEVKDIVDNYLRGAITENEKSNRVIDKWKIAAAKVTDALMIDLLKDQGGLNAINIMYLSGARGSKDQIKQLGAMRGLMEKPSKIGSDTQAEVIETPIKSNFREGLNVLEYFISTHGARKGLADTALKTADAGYLTRRLVDVAQNAIILQDDCGTIEGIEVMALKEGQEVVQSLADRIFGATATEDIIDPVTGKVLVEAGEEISNDMAVTIQKHGITSVKIRSVLTCEAEKGICKKCYGRNLATQKTAMIGDPVGIVAAQSIGEPGTQLTLRTFHIGGASATDVDIAEVRSNQEGIVEFSKMNVIVNRKGEMISTSFLGRIRILNPKDRTELENYKVEYAATIYVKDGDLIEEDTRLFTWDHYSNPLIATSEGTVKLENFVKDLTFKEEFNDLTGSKEITIIESKDKKYQPQIRIIAPNGTSEQMPLPQGLSIEVEDGIYVYPGDVLGKSSRITVKQHDITGGLPKVQELFEARVPRDKAILTEISGIVTIGEYSKLGRAVYVTSDNGTKTKYMIPPGKRLLVHQNDIVDSGDALSDGQLDPHDILKAKGIKAAQMLLLNEIQEVYRKQGVKIDDKHISIIIRQMFKKVKINDPGKTFFLEGEVVDKNSVMYENKKVEDAGEQGATFEQLLLGITKASLLTDSWLSAASFQETTKVLTQSAIEGKTDTLEGLKESIILGHRVPVGTGAKYYTKMVKEELEQGKTVAEIINHFAHVEKSDSIEDILDF